MLTQQEVQVRIVRAQTAVQFDQYQVDKGEATNVFRVRNGDGPHAEQAVYTVSFAETATGVCTCPDFQTRGGPACKHTALVVLTQWPGAFERWEGKVLAEAESNGDETSVPTRGADPHQAAHELDGRLHSGIQAALADPDVVEAVTELLVEAVASVLARPEVLQAVRAIAIPVSD